MGFVHGPQACHVDSRFGTFGFGFRVADGLGFRVRFRVRGSGVGFTVLGVELGRVSGWT